MILNRIGSICRQICVYKESPERLRLEHILQTRAWILSCILQINMLSQVILSTTYIDDFRKKTDLVQKVNSPELLDIY